MLLAICFRFIYTLYHALRLYVSHCSSNSSTVRQMALDLTLALDESWSEVCPSVYNAVLSMYTTSLMLA